MENTHPQHHHTKSSNNSPAIKEDIIKLALSATLHCLLGCGIGEVLGMVIATWAGMTMISSMILGISLGFVFGFALGVIPLLRKGFSFSKSLKIVLIAEGLSILVMEVFELFTQVAIPGVMDTGISDSIFWLGMFASLIAGFIAAFPVNYYLVKRGVRHQH